MVCRAGNLIERFFNKIKIKQCRAFAPRYHELATNYRAFVKPASICIRLCPNEVGRTGAFSGEVDTRFLVTNAKRLRRENASKQKPEPFPFCFSLNGKGSGQAHQQARGRRFGS